MIFTPTLLLGCPPAEPSWLNLNTSEFLVLAEWIQKSEKDFDKKIKEIRRHYKVSTRTAETLRLYHNAGIKERS